MAVLRPVALLPAALLLVALPLQAGEPLELEDFHPPYGNWRTAGEVAIAPEDSKRLAIADGAGLIVNGAAGRTSNLRTRAEYGDLEVHAEFYIPAGSNSGVYLQGRYEIQVRDSHGVERPRAADAGGIYQRWDESRDPKGWGGVPPRVNASKPAGEWQTLDILFRAPRFNEAGEKIEDAVFVQVVLNGTVVQRNEPLGGPTRAAGFADEVPRGPLMLQGDHGPVAYRNLRVREVDLDHHGLTLGVWRPLDLENEFEIVLESGFDAEPDDVFTIADGEIHTLYGWPEGKPAPQAMLVSKRRYSHFDLEFELQAGKRQFPPGLGQKPNAGFLFHIQANTPVWPPCLELQGRLGDRGDHFSIRGVGGTQVTAVGELKPLPDRDFSRGVRWRDAETPGWNRLRVEVRGDRARYFVNGAPVNEIRRAVFGGLPCRAGFIAFQSEFAEASYRNVRLRPLAAP